MHTYTPTSVSNSSFRTLSPWRGHPCPTQPQVDRLRHPLQLPSRLLPDPDSTRLTSHVPGLQLLESQGSGASPQTLFSFKVIPRFQQH